MTTYTLVAVGLAAMAMTKPPTTPAKAPPADTQPAESPAPAAPAAPSKPAKAEIPVAFPHPMISEVLYAVPSGDEGDANQDGTRHATGDEFIEIFNPHPRAINLRGYALSDRSKGKKGAMQFIFPDCDLRPGQVAVVFNGYQANITGPVGDSQAAPKEPSKKFHGAMVFSMKNTKESIGLANAGDCAILTDPSGSNVHIVKWGKFTDKMQDAKLIEEAPTASKCSVQRRGFTGMFAAHSDVDGLPSSPGKFDAGAVPPRNEPREDDRPAPAKTDPGADESAPKPKKK
ncbi:MAG: lamin tail domain-containing protein [Phycisphaerales bacterium]